ncbi:hypothetical protein ACT3TS_05090 [Specibacter sp. AOP5-B1-6]|uniref:hypothetical protein n=1 Tax=Specibacter sp. AOP5-B1-6 TaxID=3457653 RepID=UPI00402B4668
MVNTQLSVLVNADAEQLWHMLREPARIAQWHGWEIEGLEEEVRQIYAWSWKWAMCSPWNRARTARC